MNRLILALIALLAGFGAQVAPAAARVSEGTEIGAVANAQHLGRQAATLAAIAETLTQPGAEQAAAPAADVPLAQVAAAPGVRIGIDRARE